MADITSSNLEKEFNYYLENQAELVKKHKGKYIVIKNQKVIGSYDSEIGAVNATIKKHPPGSFLVQKCELGTESYTEIYHSRVAFG